MTTTTLDTALDLMRRKALARYPAEATRINLGYGIAQTGGVELLPDGTAMVASQTFQDTRYAVNGHCICRDAEFRAPEGKCKHKYARTLYRRALAYAAKPRLQRYPVLKAID